MATTTRKTTFSRLLPGDHYYSSHPRSDRFVKLACCLQSELSPRNAVNGGGTLVHFEPGDTVYLIESQPQREAPRKMQPSKALANLRGLAFGFVEPLDELHAEAEQAQTCWLNLAQAGGQREDAAAQLLANLAPHVERIRRWAEIVGQQLADMSADPYSFENSEASTVA